MSRLKHVTVCPTRGRPHIAKRMYESWFRTKRLEAQMFMYVANDDPCIHEYQRLFYSREDNPYLNMMYGPRIPVVQVYNKSPMEFCPGLKYYSNVNDDHVYITEGWDEIMVDHLEKNGGWGIVSPNDQMTDWEKCKHPSAEMYSGNIPQTLGHIFLPYLQHLGADEYLMELGKGINRLWMMPNVIVEHRHVFKDKSLMDDNYRDVYSEESVKLRDSVLKMWRETGQREREIKRLLDAMERDGIGKEQISVS